MNKRHQLKWIPGNHEGDHNNCDCDLEVSFPSLSLPKLLEKRQEGKRRTVREMYASVKANIVSSYYLVRQDEVVKIQKMAFDQVIYTDYMREYYTSPSQIAVSPPYHIVNELNLDYEPINRSLIKVQQDVEDRYWKRVFPTFPKIEPSYGSLQGLIRKRLSWVDVVHDKWYGADRIVHTKKFMPLRKVLDLYAGFGKDTSRRSQPELKLWQYVPAALTTLLHQMDIPKDYGTIKFEYDPKELVKSIRLFRSGGIAPGGDVWQYWRGYKIRVTARGDKIRVIEMAMRKTHRIIYTIFTDPNYVPYVLDAILRIKDEFKEGMYFDQVKLQAIQEKIRLFFMPEPAEQLIEQLLNSKRMLKERNRIICVGMKWWYGGAYFLYKKLNGDLPGFFYVCADISGLDKSISDWLLMLYCLNLYPYYDWASMNEKDSSFLERLLIYWATNVAAKMVCHVGSFWRFMRGVMPSGAKVTSSGNSWIMAFIFYTFCEYTKELYPHMAALIDEFLILMFIIIVVYGDDHIWCAPLVLRPYMNAKTWKKFLKDFYNMDARDEEEFDSLLSEIDDTGRLKRKGPVFLKRHLIANTIDSSLAPVLPFKDIDLSMCRTFTTKYDNIIQILMSVNGMLWDTYGVNKEAWATISDYRDQIIALYAKDAVTAAKEALVYAEGSVFVQKMLRKSNITIDELMNVPTREQILQRHVLDGVKSNYHVITDDSIMFDDGDWEFLMENETYLSNWDPSSLKRNKRK